MNESHFDVVISGGTVFDGDGGPGVRRDVGIVDGVVRAVSSDALDVGPDTEVIDATGQWIMPGFIDVHTHYDAEVLVGPGLVESVRHGVTTVLLGNCSLSTLYSTPVDIADLFSRVEALPRDHVLKAVDTHKTWDGPEEYIAALERLPLGPNIASLVGHSDLRAHVMGLDRSTDRSQKPTREETAQMSDALEKALDAGMLGMSTMTNPWDKLDGDRYRSRSLPSSYASWSEFRRLHKILRRRGRLLQSIPNLNTKYDMVFFLGAATGIGRRALKVSLLAAADAKASPWIHHIFGPLAAIVNGPGKGQFRWQHLPTTFDVYSDGIDLVVFEEFGSGRAALHLREELGRNELLKDEAYRRWFRADFEKKFSSRVWHRDFGDVIITECPDASVIGKNVAELAREQGIHVVDAFLDLVVEHGRKLRWHTTIANHRRKQMDKLITKPGVTVGFSDAGAHLRNMAFYNFGIRLLRRVHDAHESFLTVGQAAHKLSGELADFYGVDTGHLRLGDRADIVVVNPAGLTDEVDAYNEESMPEFSGLSRMVNRNDDAVTATLIGGRVVYREGRFASWFGVSERAGRFLRAGVRTPAATTVSV
ncbi:MULTISPECIES: amidohydrolase family protein [Nocardiaceae]|uniref:N-acyl-D-aspartate/D-glutamate deacylase n=1 Tax=Rhodococcoides corynebacterioides TaxID=53972 RepID=A0ABS2KX04_9NOCA|nr:MULTISPECIES: amidohydrolase family protein [Rhodococcus]MBM7416463.1 N-acyl-D-aspartate/D-glutamate deacylase [Rhodococcus corynebacterioides]MBP1114716.1 N-acyl-D-aspartate/D-glutamate deacylase [Rhodococcus sp. PvP016]